MDQKPFFGRNFDRDSRVKIKPFNKPAVGVSMGTQNMVRVASSQDKHISLCRNSLFPYHQHVGIPCLRVRTFLKSEHFIYAYLGHVPRQ